MSLTHWGRVTHICVSKLTIIASDNGLSPGRRQAIIWTSAGILLIGPLWTNFSEILIGIQAFSFKKMYLKMSCAKWRPFCLGLNELTALFRCLWLSGNPFHVLSLCDTSPGLSPSVSHRCGGTKPWPTQSDVYRIALVLIHGTSRPAGGLIIWIAKMTFILDLLVSIIIYKYHKSNKSLKDILISLIYFFTDSTPDISK